MSDGQPYVVPSASAVVGADRVFGVFTVMPGRITFVPGGTANSLVSAGDVVELVHTDPVVTLVVARLLPPNLNTGVVLVLPPCGNPWTTAVVQLAAWRRADAVCAIRESGFAVECFRTWFQMGGAIGSRSELERFRSVRRGG